MCQLKTNNSKIVRRIQETIKQQENQLNKTTLEHRLLKWNFNYSLINGITADTIHLFKFSTPIYLYVKL